MSMSREEMRIVLSRDEPDYQELATQVDASDIPLLREFAIGGDPMLSTKAVYLASLLDADSAVDIVDVAARSRNELVRIAAASALSNISDERGNEIAMTLIGDPSLEIKKLTLIAVKKPSAELKVRIESLVDETGDERLRDLAQERLRTKD